MEQARCHCVTLWLISTAIWEPLAGPQKLPKPQCQFLLKLEAPLMVPLALTTQVPREEPRGGMQGTGAQATPPEVICPNHHPGNPHSGPYWLLSSSLLPCLLLLQTTPHDPLTQARLRWFRAAHCLALHRALIPLPSTHYPWGHGPSGWHLSFLPPANLHPCPTPFPGHPCTPPNSPTSAEPYPYLPEPLPCSPDLCLLSLLFLLPARPQGPQSPPALCPASGPPD